LEISFSRRFKTMLIFFLILVTGLAVVAILALRITGRTFFQVIGFDSGQTAAVQGAQVFYSVDFKESPEKWAARLCAMSTGQGCTFYEQIAPTLWQAFLNNQTVVTAEVQAVGKVFEGKASARENVLMQVWEVSVVLSSAWPQSTNGATSFAAYVLVMRTQTGWKFERLLMDAEAERYVGGGQ